MPEGSQSFRAPGELPGRFDYDNEGDKCPFPFVLDPWRGTGLERRCRSWKLIFRICVARSGPVIGRRERVPLREPGHIPNGEVDVLNEFDVDIEVAGA